MGNLPVMPFVVAIPVYILIGFTIIDVLRRPDLSAARKALWAAAVVVLPVVGTLIYFLARPFEDPAHEAVRGNERTQAIVALVEQREEGSIDEREFTDAKRRIFDDAMAAHGHARA